MNHFKHPGVCITWILSALLLWSSAAHAVIESYDFETEELRERYYLFAAELRCPKCQNQNLAGSNSPIAADLRAEVHRLLHEGYTDEQIVDYMVERYGEFILYRPPVNRHTLILWLFPLLSLGAGILALFYLLRRRQAEPAAGAGEVAEDAELVHRRASDLLQSHDQESR